MVQAGFGDYVGQLDRRSFIQNRKKTLEQTESYTLSIIHAANFKTNDATAVANFSEFHACS